VLQLQTEIATAVANSLRVTLLADAATRIELGGTHVPAAFDAFLRGGKAWETLHPQDAITAYSEAIRLDPNYALALANRSLALTYLATLATGADGRASLAQADEDARRAVALAPDLAEAHLALAYDFEADVLDFPRAAAEYARALALAPGNSRVLRDFATFAVPMGQTDRGIAAAQRAVLLDPLNYDAHHDLGWTLYYGGHVGESIAAYHNALVLMPGDAETQALSGLASYVFGDYERARSSCEGRPDHWMSEQCLAITYGRLGQHDHAEVALARLKAARGDRGAYLYTTIEAQWGDVGRALEWLDTALRLRDPMLELLRSDPLLDPLRKEPRFQAIERALKFPD
jgi:tetratricopeptide (TPR) repeat protein